MKLNITRNSDGKITRVAVYGFGSYFHDRANSEDIDLLVLHADTSPISVALAIRCKRELISNLYAAHVTMLSRKEEQTFEFIATAGAKFLSEVRAESFESDLNELIELIRTFPLIFSNCTKLPNIEFYRRKSAEQCQECLDLPCPSYLQDCSHMF